MTSNLADVSRDLFILFKSFTLPFHGYLHTDMFDGTIISKGNSSQGDDSEMMVDVEDDETAVYGPPQYPMTSYRLPIASLGDTPSSFIYSIFFWP